MAFEPSNWDKISTDGIPIGSNRPSIWNLVKLKWCKLLFVLILSLKWNAWDSLTVIQYWLLWLQWYLLVLNYTGIIQKTTFHSCKEKAEFDKKSAYRQPGRNIYKKLNDSDCEFWVKLIFWQTESFHNFTKTFLRDLT